MLGFFRNNFGFGGNNGLTDFKETIGINLQRQEPCRRSSPFLLGAGARFAFVVAIITSKFGKVLIASVTRNPAPGSSAIVWSRYKLFVFVVSACMAGVAGRSMCHRSASSIRANSRRPTPSRR